MPELHRWFAVFGDTGHGPELLDMVHMPAKVSEEAVHAFLVGEGWGELIQVKGLDDGPPEADDDCLQRGAVVALR